MVINNTEVKAKNYYTYTATGTKLKIVYRYDPNGLMMPLLGTIPEQDGLKPKSMTDYVGNKIYEDGVLKMTLTDNGYYDNLKNTYYFYIKDHLGNNRIVADASGKSVQSNQYYPFGMAFAEGTTTEQGKQEFKYNGKELDRTHGLNWYDYSARQLDNAIGRFTAMDPMSEKRFWLSPYAYCSNNPMNRIDPDGMLDISKLTAKTHYGVIAVFPETRDRKLNEDYKAANDAGIATIQVFGIDDFVKGMNEMAGLGITTDAYTLNSHGGPGFFFIGDQMTSNKITDVSTTPFQDISIMQEGLSGKNVFIGSCNVTQDRNVRGLDTIERFSKKTNATVISSDHLLATKFKYDGSDHLSKPWDATQLELIPSLRNQVNNTYHLAKPDEKPVQIFNFTIDKNGKFSWDTSNK